MELEVLECIQDVMISAQGSVHLYKLSQRLMSVPVVAQQLLKAILAVGLPVTGVRLVLSVPEGSPAVSADEALGMELVPHGGDHSVQARLVAHAADRGAGPLIWTEQKYLIV